MQTLLQNVIPVPVYKDEGSYALRRGDDERVGRYGSCILCFGGGGKGMTGGPMIQLPTKALVRILPEYPKSPERRAAPAPSAHLDDYRPTAGWSAWPHS